MSVRHSRPVLMLGLAALLLLVVPPVLEKGRIPSAPHVLDGSRYSASLLPRVSETPNASQEAVSALAEVRAIALQLVNEDRAGNGLDSLREDRLLSLAAQRHAEDMLRRHYFDHRSPEGQGPAERYRAVGGPASTGVGENILVVEGDRLEFSPERLETFEREWMSSAGHRANILGRQYRLFGFGIAADPNSGEIYAVQMFAGVGRVGRR